MAAYIPSLRDSSIHAHCCRTLELGAEVSRDAETTQCEHGPCSEVKPLAYVFEEAAKDGGIIYA